MKHKKTTQQTIAGVLSGLLALFLPNLKTGDSILDAFINFAAFTPLVIYASSWINTRLAFENAKAYATTGLVALTLSYIAYLLDFGFLAKSTSLWWHPLLTSLGIFASAVLGFSQENINKLLKIIFDYSFKNEQIRPDTGKNKPAE